jgi:RimJ/RimL family protein N-acetyltransferase
MLEKTELELQARHVKLRRMRQDDAQALYDYRSLPEVARYQDWLPDDLEAVHELAREQAALELGTPGSWFQWIICNAATGEIAGDCGYLFGQGEHDAPELGIALSPRNRGRGYATVATRLMIDHLFGELKVHRIVARVDPRNYPAIGILGRVGMTREAHHRLSHWHRGKWVDDMVFAMLREDWLRDRD